MQFAIHYGSNKHSGVLHDWRRAVRLCGISFTELTERFCPEAGPLARCICEIDIAGIRKAIADHSETAARYVEVMRGRIVETANHYVVDGIIFIREDIISINLDSYCADLSHRPDHWFTIESMNDMHSGTNLTEHYAGFIERAARRLVDLPGRDTYLAAIPKDIREIILAYIAAPARHMIKNKAAQP